MRPWFRLALSSSLWNFLLLRGRNRGDQYGRLTNATEVITRLPCWEHLSTEEYRKRVAALVEEIELDARVARLERKTPVLGVGAVLAAALHAREGGPDGRDRPW